jgi:hypothetical protein
MRAGGDGCVVGAGDGLDDGQAQPESVATAGAVWGEALERLEELVYRGCRDHWPGIGYGQDGAGAPGLGAYFDLAAGQVVLQRVVDQVGDQVLCQARAARCRCSAERCF